MEVRDGFIVGIFNYCDRWCETCAFTSRCQLFADVAETHAALDPNLKAVVDAPPLPEEVPPPPPRWLEELKEQANEAAAPTPPEEDERLQPTIAPQHEVIEERAMAYCLKVFAWLRSRNDGDRTSASDPRSIISWFHTMIGVKTHRALKGFADDLDWRDRPPDSDGSAKVALLGIERSHAAWLQLVDTNVASMAEIQPFVADLVGLAEKLDDVFPNARAFVRPAFDEPDEVAKLLASDGG